MPPAPDTSKRTDTTNYGEEPDTPYLGLAFETGSGSHSNGANGSSSMPIQDQEQSQNQDVRMEREHSPFGVGIKEDG